MTESLFASDVVRIVTRLAVIELLALKNLLLEELDDLFSPREATRDLVRLLDLPDSHCSQSPLQDGILNNQQGRSATHMIHH